MKKNKIEILDELAAAIEEIRNRVDLLADIVDELRQNIEDEDVVHEEIPPVAIAESVEAAVEDVPEEIEDITDLDLIEEPVAIFEPAPVQEPESAPETEVEPEQEAEPEQETESEPEAESEAVAVPEQEAESESEAVAVEEPESVPEPDVELEQEFKDEADDEPYVELGGELEPEEEPAEEAEPEPEEEPEELFRAGDINEMQAEMKAPLFLDVMATRNSWKNDIPGPEVKDVRSAISLNDRVLFINHLFGEDPAAFQSVLNAINSMTAFSEAEEYMYRLHPEWNFDSDIVYRFMMAIRRKLK